MFANKILNTCSPGGNRVAMHWQSSSKKQKYKYSLDYPIGELNSQSPETWRACIFPCEKIEYRRHITDVSYITQGSIKVKNKNNRRVICLETTQGDIEMYPNLSTDRKTCYNIRLDDQDGIDDINIYAGWLYAFGGQTNEICVLNNYSNNIAFNYVTDDIIKAPGSGIVYTDWGYRFTISFADISGIELLGQCAIGNGSQTANFVKIPKLYVHGINNPNDPNVHSITFYNAVFPAACINQTPI